MAKLIWNIKLIFNTGNNFRFELYQDNIKALGYLHNWIHGLLGVYEELPNSNYVNLISMIACLGIGRYLKLGI